MGRQSNGFICGYTPSWGSKPLYMAYKRCLSQDYGFNENPDCALKVSKDESDSFVKYAKSKRLAFFVTDVSLFFSRLEDQLKHSGWRISYDTSADLHAEKCNMELSIEDLHNGNVKVVFEDYKYSSDAAEYLECRVEFKDSALGLAQGIQDVCSDSRLDPTVCKLLAELTAAEANYERRK